MTIIYLPLLTKQSASNYQRMIVIGEQQLKINYNSTSDTIPFQKTINLTSDQANSIEKSTISFWFKPTVYSNSSLFRRRRNLENVYLDKTNTILKYQGVSYSITEINYNQTSLDSYETFNSYLKNYTNSFIFNILCTLDSGAFTNMIGMSYRNSNGFYGISFQTNNKSFDIILSSLSSAIFASNWCFISIGLDYTSNALMQVTIVQKEVVIIAKIPIESPSKFYNPSMNLGSLTKQPTEFLKNTVCNCAVSSFIWDLDIFTLNETLDLRRTIMSPIFYGDFNESTENLLSLSPATNNFVDNYEGEGAKKPEFLLGDNSKNYTNPYLDRVKQFLYIF